MVRQRVLLKNLVFWLPFMNCVYLAWPHNSSSRNSSWTWVLVFFSCKTKTINSKERTNNGFHGSQSIIAFICIFRMKRLNRISYICLFVTGWHVMVSNLDKLSETEVHLHKNVFPCFTHTGEGETQILNDREREWKKLCEYKDRVTV